MRYAIIQGGAVANITTSDAEFAAAQGWIDAQDAKIGDLWDGAVFTTPAPVVLVPTSVSPRQIRQALTRAGLRASVEAAVAAGDQDLKDWWEFSTSFERLNPQVVSMGSLLGQTDEQLDALWILGNTL